MHLRIISIYIIIVTLPLFGQNSKVRELQGILENYSSVKEMKAQIKNMSLNEVKHAARIYFEAFEEDAVFTASFLAIRDKEIDSINKSNNLTGLRGRVMPNETKWKLLDKFKKSFQSDLYYLITVPYLLKVKIEIIESYIYEDKLSPAKLPRTDITAKVLDVIKGTNRFKAGDDLKFYFMDHWRPTRSKFSEGETYLIPVYPITEYDNSYSHLALNTNINNSETHPDEKSFGMFPIIDEKLIDPNDSFGCGEPYNWKQCKDKLQRKINLIKSW